MFANAVERLDWYLFSMSGIIERSVTDNDIGFAEACLHTFGSIHANSKVGETDRCSSGHTLTSAVVELMWGSSGAFRQDIYGGNDKLEIDKFLTSSRC